MARTSKYDKEFIERSVKLALTTSQPITQTAQELGITVSTLYSWIQRHKDLSVKKDLSANDMYEELAALRKENAKLREEREILKKPRHSLRKSRNKI